MPSDVHAPCAVLVLCGLPGAGKSFLSHLLLKHQRRLLDNREVQVHHLCFDDALNAALQTAGGSFSPEAWQDARQQNMAKLRLLLTSSCSPAPPSGSVDQSNQQASSGYNAPRSEEQAQQADLKEAPHMSDEPRLPCRGSQAAPDHGAPAVDRLALILVDDNMQYRSMRYKCLQLVRENSAAFLLVHINCPLQLALQRNAQREGPQRVPDESIRRMAEVMEPPDPQLHPWETPCLVLQAEALDQYSGSQVWTWIAASWGSGLTSRCSQEDEDRSRAQDRAANAENALHHVDICTRRMLSAFLSAAPRQHQAAWASQANAERRQLLSKLRSCWQQQHEEDKGQRETRMITLDHLVMEFDQHLSSLQSDRFNTEP